MSALTDFELSRLYGQGWNAAKKLLREGHSEIGVGDAARLNPYRAIRDAERWTEGFKQALESKAGPLNTPGGNQWRPAISD